MVSRKENKHSQLAANMRGLVCLGQVTVDPTGHPQGRYLHVEGRGTSVVSAVLPVLQTSPPSHYPSRERSPVNYLCPLLPAQLHPNNCRLEKQIAKRQPAIWGDGTPVTKSSAKWTVRLSPACWRICHRPVSERREYGLPLCSRRGGDSTAKPYRKSFNTAGMSGPFLAELQLET